MKVSPMVASSSTASAWSRRCCAAVGPLDIVATKDPPTARKLCAAESAASVSRVRLDRDLSCPGATSAKASCRFFGFSTMPTTRSARPFTGQLSPILRLSMDATPEVTATWAASLG